MAVALVAVVVVVESGNRLEITMAFLALESAAAAATWRSVAPHSFEGRIAGPFRRWRYRRWVRRQWVRTAEACGLGASVRGESFLPDQPQIRSISVSRLIRVRCHGNSAELSVATRLGQTVEDIEAAAPRLAASFGAVGFRVRHNSSGAGSIALIELIVADPLLTVRIACIPSSVGFDRLSLGRTLAGDQWWLQLQGRHTLIAGCSGAGKGSLLWGICCGLSPAANVGLVRLWGIDLKRGVELELGAPLFSARAYRPSDALDLLKGLLAEIDRRGDEMAGTTRLHQPIPGDPLHVLVIDELAALTSYAEPAIRKEAERLLSEILTQGRALGVVVVACLQDPRKEVVGMRGLFTQTIALRMRAPEETAMVLGDGMAKLAPAHRISPAHPGMAWIVDDAGYTDRVRADFWTDDLIRQAATRFGNGETDGERALAEVREFTRKEAG